MTPKRRKIVGYIAIISQEKYGEVDQGQYLWLQKGLYADVRGMVVSKSDLEFNGKKVNIVS